MNNSIEDFSEDVEEILNAPPSGLMVWGTTGIVIALFLMGFVGWMYKFPEKITEDFYLTTEKPPVSLPAPFRTKVAEYFVEEGQTVFEGDPILYLEDGAKLEHIDSLEKEMNLIASGELDFKDFNSPKNLQLGEVAQKFNNFKTRLRIYFEIRKINREKINDKELSELRKNNFNNIESLNAKISDIEEEIIDLNQRWKKANEDAGKEEDPLKKSSLEKNASNLNYTRKEKRREKEILKQYLRDAYEQGQEIVIQENRYNLDAESDEDLALTELQGAWSELREAIFNWKEKHILKAHISGKVTFYGAPEEEGFFEFNDPILSIIPTQDEDKYLAHVKLAVQKLSKIEIKDSVLLKFNRYPFLEFGGVRGEVQEKIPINDNPDFYAIKINLKDGLKTSLNQKLDFQHKMTGKAEIIVDDKRFIVRLLEDFLAIFNGRSK